jgi:DNA-binding IclR family transcriptional regulator
MARWPTFEVYEPRKRGDVVATQAGADPGFKMLEQSVVPAVERAIAILRYLSDNADRSAGTVSRISRALDLNKSTCSNILRTMSAAGLIEQDLDSKAYRLGPELIGLGVKASQRREFTGICTAHLQGLTRQTGFTSVAFEQMPNSEFVIVGRAESPKDLKVTLDVGQHFPPTVPTMSRVCLAWQSDNSAEEYIARWGLPAYTSSTMTDRTKLKRELKKIRAQGYSATRGEYYPANTAIVSPVFSPRQDACRGIGLVAFSSEIADVELVQIAEKVRSAAQAITIALGGQFKME